MNKTPWTITLVAVIALVAGTLLVLSMDPPAPADPNGHAHGDEAGHDEHEHEGDGNESHAGHVHGDAEHDHESDQAAPHESRVLLFGQGSVEVAIFEQGVPPEFRIYVDDGHGHAPSFKTELWQLIATAENRTDTFTFVDGGGFLRSKEKIAEPHEFQVLLKGEIHGMPVETTYVHEEPHEHGSGHGPSLGGSLGTIAISETVLRESGITFQAAGSGDIQARVQLPGEVTLNADRVAHIVPRFPGVALAVNKNLGDHVAKGEVLAVVQSNESVAPYDIKSMLAGTVVEKHITLGEYVRDDNDIYVVADLSTVWVNISVYPKYFNVVKPGARVTIRITGNDDEVLGTVSYVGPLVGERTRTATARVVLDNSSRRWQPGLFVTAYVGGEVTPAAIAVPDAAVQTVEDQPSVFVKTSAGIDVRPVKLGRADGRWIEILEGLVAGEMYAATNTFLLKAEFGKSEAGHDH